MKIAKSLIDGKWVRTEKTFSNTCPANLEEVIEVHEVGTKEIDSAVNCARKAFSNWHQLGVSEKVIFLKRLKEAIYSNRDKIVDIINLETGKPKTEAMCTEILSSLEYIDYFAKKAKSIEKKKSVKMSRLFLSILRKNYIIRQPKGVVVVISPYNMPFIMPIVVTIPALLAGNTVLFKASEFTSLTGSIIGQLFESTQIPKGVFQVLVGRGKVGHFLVASDVDMISFTGTSDVAGRIQEVVLGTSKKLIFELNGKNSAIVCEDANLQLAAKGILWGGFSNAGQLCSSIERVYVTENKYRELIKLLVQMTQKLRVGNGLDSEVDIGPLMNEKQLVNIRNQLEDAIRKNGIVECGGVDIAKLKGHYFEPTIVSNVNHDMTIMKEETFGPVIAVMAVKNIEEAVELSNDTDYGLCASIWTNNKKLGKEIAAKLKVGTVWINDVNFTSPTFPWGGIKKSGFGKVSSRYGYEEFTDTKLVSLNKYSIGTGIWWFPYSKFQAKLYDKIANFI